MNAQTPDDKASTNASSAPPDDLFRSLKARAAALGEGAIGAADALVTTVVGSVLPESTFDPLAKMIAKSTGLDAAAIKKQMVRARAAMAGATPASNSEGVAPANNPRPPADMLKFISQVVANQVLMGNHEAVAVTLWIVASYGYRAADVFPRLAVTSETRRCGKSVLLGTVRSMCFEPEVASNISAAAMSRLIATKPMTLLIDEADSFVRSDEGLRNVLNAGAERGAVVKRVEPTPDGKSFQVINLPCFCPVMLCGIGGLPDTVIDRSIVIRLQRAPPGSAARGRRMRYGQLRDVRRAVVPHLLAHAPAIEDAIARAASTALIPSELNDRAADCWEPMFAVADLAGDEWPQRAREAAVALSGRDHGNAGLVEKLLADIRLIVEAPRLHAVTARREWGAAGRVGLGSGILPRSQRPAQIRSCDLVDRLLGMPHRPWREVSHGRPLTERWLSDRLRGLGVSSGRGRVAPWAFDADGEPTGAMPVQGSQLPQARTYAVADLRAVCRRMLT